MVGRHRHSLSVREDGLAAVLGALLDDRKVTAAVLVDLDSGMVLDACSASSGAPSSAAPVDLDVLGAAHAELLRVALGVVADGTACGAPSAYELVLSCGDGPHHLLRGIPDPFGDRVALSVVVAGSARNLRRVRRRLRSVSSSALTAGPTARRRPGEHGWRPGLVEPTGVPPRREQATVAPWPPPLPPPPPPPPPPLPRLPLPRLLVQDHGRPAPPSALPPAPRRT